MEYIIAEGRIIVRDESLTTVSLEIKSRDKKESLAVLLVAIKELKRLAQSL